MVALTPFYVLDWVSDILLEVIFPFKKQVSNAGAIYLVLFLIITS